MFEELKEKAYRANIELHKSGLVIYTWGNVSERSEDGKYMAIKPSGVPYDDLTIDSMVVIDIDTGETVEGDLNPSSDSKTHLEIYRAFPGIRGVTHTHSINAVAFSQAGIDIPLLGTTHADYSSQSIPCTKDMDEESVFGDYEKNTGRIIVSTLMERKLDVGDTVGILVRNHGPFTWGSSAMESVKNAVILETIAEMAYKTLTINRDAAIPPYLVKKHYERKHGKNAYYGQIQGEIL